MAVRYAWECPKCQATIELAATQAGQELTCASCSAVVEAPKLGVIKSFPVVGGEVAGSRTVAGGRSALKSWLFAGGLLLAILAGAAGGWAQYTSNQYYVDVDVETLIEEEFKALDEAPPAEIYAIAAGASEESFTLEYAETPYRTYSIKSGIIQYVAWAFWGVAGIGILMLLASFFLK